MREIKFRVWHEKVKIMSDVITPDYLQKDFVEVDKDGIWMQYTGLKDKNGVEIFEGDIFYDDADNHIGVVSFINGAFVAESHLDGFEKQKLEPVDNRYFLAERLIKDFGNQLEVIGNIYENTELLDV